MFTAGFLARLPHEKYMLGRPVHRIAAAPAAGAGDRPSYPGRRAQAGRRAAAASWSQAIAACDRQAGHAHCDETSWQVFEDIAGKENHRWWPWVSATADTNTVVMRRRPAQVGVGRLGIDLDQAALEAGRCLVISSGFHRACPYLARIDGVDALWCSAASAGTSCRPVSPPGRWAFASLDTARIQQTALAGDGLLHPAAARVIARGAPDRLRPSRRLGLVRLAKTPPAPGRTSHYRRRQAIYNEVLL